MSIFKKIGRLFKPFLKTATQKLKARVFEKYPDVIAGIRKGIADYESKDMNGVDKGVAVALDALAVAPAILASLPRAKDFFIGLVHDVFVQDMLPELERAAGEALKKL